ncbi:MAG: DUF11 domain-containing protein [Planctomycetes bacterium]|nr:DUF11 domain-containing protein [Planctomycetota bacterium]
MQLRKWTWMIVGSVGIAWSLGGLGTILYSGERLPTPPKLLRRTIDYFSRSGRTGTYLSHTAPKTSADKSNQPSGDRPSAASSDQDREATSPKRYRRTGSPPLAAGLFVRRPSNSSSSQDPFLQANAESGQSARKAEPETAKPSRDDTVRSASAPATQPATNTASKKTAAGQRPSSHSPRSGQPNPKVTQVIHADHKQASGRSKNTDVRPAGVSPADQLAFPWAESPKKAPQSTAEGKNPLASGNPSPSKAKRPKAVVLPASPHPKATGSVVAVLPAAPSSGSPIPLSRGPNLPATKNYGSYAPTIKLQWIKRSEITVGQPCRVELQVSNTGEAPAEDLIVAAYFPSSVRLTQATPEPIDNGDHLSWNIDSLAPGSSERMQVELIPIRRGDLDLTALVRFTASSSTALTVEEPLLALEMKGPTEVLVGDPASQIVTVSNPGTGVAHNVVLEVQVPDGLEHPRGRHLMMELGSLGPGESRMVRLSLAAVAGGTKTLELHARSDGGLSETVSTQITVIAPSLKLAVEGPGLRYVGRRARYTVTVSNDGGAATNNVRVTHQLPSGFRFIEADNGGSFDQSSRTVRWFIGRLEPGETRQLHVELDAVSLGEFVHRVAATCEQGANAETETETKVDGTARLVLKVVDLDDPVEVGRETVYEIRVSNDGTKAAQNVALACELPAGVELLSVQGATPHSVENNKVIFQALPQLLPEKTALFRLHVRGTAAGDHRVRAQLSSDSVQEPLVVDELTKFYAD